MQKIKVINTTRCQSESIAAMYLSDFWGKLKGLMFKTHLNPDDSIILDQKSESRIGSAIHMLFMNFEITAIWVDSDLKVVDTRLAKPWAFAYIPKKAARYVIETTRDYQENYQPGDQLEFTYE